jgi:hypothetical protein
MIYLYAICNQQAAIPQEVRGVDLAPLVELRHSDIGAVVSVIEEGAPVPSPQRLWQHERVVETLMNRRTVLPARFATVFDHKDDVLQQLHLNEAVYIESLARVRGCVELGLRVLRMVEPPASVTEDENDGIPCPNLLASEKNGRTFEIARSAANLQRDALRRRDESLGEILNRSLSICANDHIARVETQTGTVLKASYLIPQGRLPEMQKTVHHLRDTYKNLHFLCTGPWPPYHFVEPILPQQQI